MTIHTPQTPQRIGIIAGRGDLPVTLYHAVPDGFVVAIKGFCNPEQWANAYVVHPIAKVGAIVKSLRAAGVTHVVLAGGVDRPSFSSLIPDAMGAKLIAKLSRSEGGDDAVLRLVLEFLQQQGFTVVGVDDIVGKQGVPKGVLTTVSPTAAQMQDIEKGVHILSVQSGLDIGQAVVVQEKIVLAVEAIEGTDAMIQRCDLLNRNGAYGPILIKCVKRQQTRDADLPTVGVPTIENMAVRGFSGLALSAQGTIALDLSHMIQLANAKGIFIISV